METDNELAERILLALAGQRCCLRPTWDGLYPLPEGNTWAVQNCTSTTCTSPHYRYTEVQVEHSENYFSVRTEDLLPCP